MAQVCLRSIVEQNVGQTHVLDNIYHESCEEKDTTLVLKYSAGVYYRLEFHYK